MLILLAAAYTGYYVGIGIEGFLIIVAAVLLVLMLTGVLFKWMANSKANAEQRKARKLAEREARLAQQEAEAAARAEAEAEAAAAEEEEEVIEEEEVEEEEVEEEPEPEPQPKKTKKSAKVEEAVEEEPEEGDSEIVFIQGDGVVFNDSKTITELYEELSDEQKSYFDELREEALQKPEAELAISKNFITVKIGKRNLIKLLIKRGVTVAEFMLENEALKQFRISNKDKKGKSRIKVKPTVVQVLDLPSLKVAIDMVNLAYEELMMDEF